MKNDKLVIRQKKLKGEDDYKTFSIRIKQDLLNEIDSIADKSGRSRNELISILLKYACERCEIE